MRINALHRDHQEILTGRLIVASEGLKGTDKELYNPNELGILTDDGRWYALGRMEAVYNDR